MSHISNHIHISVSVSSAPKPTLPAASGVDPFASAAAQMAESAIAQYPKGTPEQNIFKAFGEKQQVRRPIIKLNFDSLLKSNPSRAYHLALELYLKSTDDGRCVFPPALMNQDLPLDGRLMRTAVQGLYTADDDYIKGLDPSKVIPAMNANQFTLDLDKRTYKVTSK